MIKVLKKVNFEEFFKRNEEVAKTTPMRTHYQSPNPLERWLWAKKKKIIYNMINLLPIKNVVDLGCGDGGLLDVINGDISYTGIDISPTQIKYTKNYIRKLSRKNAKVYLGDVTNLKIEDNSFDAALVCDIVEHVLAPEKLFKEVKRIVKKNGYIIFSIPNEPLWQTARAITLRFPLRSPDHLYAIYPNDIRKRFPYILRVAFLPVRFSSTLSLVHIFLVKNVK